NQLVISRLAGAPVGWFRHRRCTHEPGITRPSSEVMAAELAQRNGTATVLAVDDDPVFLQALERVLAQNGYQVRTAASTAEALAQLEREPVDLMISDLCLPGNDALHLLRDLRKRKCSIPVIILTAGGGVESYLEAMNCGAFDYATKPVKDVELLALVRRALDSEARLSSRPSPLSEEPSPWR
ncbi:MAG TPA: response regulator, partial [Candidatus Acidoferrales bacterium]